MGKKSKRQRRLYRQLRNLNRNLHYLASEIVLAETALFGLRRAVAQYLSQQNANPTPSESTIADASTPDNDTGWTTVWTYPSRS